jgi:hypothetical protein
MHSHPHLLHAAAKVHMSERLKDAERRGLAQQVARQPGRALPLRDSRVNARLVAGAMLLRLAGFVSGNAARADSAGA